MAKMSKLEAAQAEVLEQQEWVRSHGGDLAGYLVRYGAKADPEHYGDGGEQIYAADRAELDRRLRVLALLS